MANPIAGQGGAPAVVNNPGVSVSLRAETNLKLACYQLRHMLRLSRIMTPPQVTLLSVQAVRELRLNEENHKNPTIPPKIDANDWPRTMEAIEEYLRGYLGTTGIPLAYVVRPDVEIPADEPDGGYASVLDEMIARAPHTAAGALMPTYVSDCMKVWELIADVCRPHPCWTFVKPAQKTRDGRMAFLKLHGHFLGESNVDTMASSAEYKLTSTTYSGEKKRYNFEKYVTVQVDQHAILTGLEQYGYKGIDNRSKVRHLLEGIKTPELDAVKTQIMASPALRSDYDRCVSLYKDYISQRSSHSPTELNISSVDSKGKKKVHFSEADAEPERWHTREEYDAMSPEEQNALRAQRRTRNTAAAKAGGGGRKARKGGKQPPRKNNNKKKGNYDKLSRTVAAMATVMLASTATADDPEETPAARQKQLSNRNNKALRRQLKVLQAKKSDSDSDN